jgi:hypothetical protein
VTALSSRAQEIPALNRWYRTFSQAFERKRPIKSATFATSSLAYYFLRLIKR